MSDLQVPEAAYKRRIEELEVEMAQIDAKELVGFPDEKNLLLFFIKNIIILDPSKKT